MANNSSIILYDFLQVTGGAESLTLTLYNAIPQLSLGVGYVDKDNFSDLDLPAPQLISLCQPTNILGWQTIKVASAFYYNRKLFSDFDKVIFSGSNTPLAVFSRKNKGNILYCHTPPRFVYDLKQHYLESISWWKKPLLRLLISQFQPRYESAINEMNLVIANSINVQQRIKKYLNKDAIVIYPPCHVDKYKWIGQGDYYLSTARVEPYKRIKLIVEAFKRMPTQKLIVASGGSQLASLKRLAHGYNNIHFSGWTEQHELEQLIGNCIATIYLPIDEDFGISPVESMAAGKPVIGVNEGGVRETVVPNISGILCPANPNIEDIIKAVKQMNREKALSLKDSCQQHAQSFSAEIFVSKMKKIIECKNSDLLQVATSIDASNPAK